MAGTLAAETTYFDSGDVVVTSARFIVPSQTYAIRNVTSVQFVIIPPSRFWAIVMVLLGLVAAIGMASFWPVVILIIPAAIIMLLQQPMYAVLLSSASGESRALQSMSSEYVKSVVDALNQAIVGQA